MPEGNIIHRLARVHHRWLVGRGFTADSPQARFTQGAWRLSGRTLLDVEAHGKHLFHRFEGGVLLHIHLPGSGGPCLVLLPPLPGDPASP